MLFRSDAASGATAGTFPYLPTHDEFHSTEVDRLESRFEEGSLIWTSGAEHWKKSDHGEEERPSRDKSNGGDTDGLVYGDGENT